jgi:hypothetical protein
MYNVALPSRRGAFRPPLGPALLNRNLLPLNRLEASLL